MKATLYTAPTMAIPWDKGKGATKRILSELYLVNGMSSNEISKIFDVTAPAICNRLRFFNIPIRPQAAQLEGQQFGRWTVVRRVENSERGTARWVCRCECGNMGISTTGALRSGNSKSCGCLTMDSARLRNGVDHPSYKNGKTNKEGYVLITDRSHPNANKRGRILEHVYVMSKHLGRPIMRGETIHHKNGIRSDNRIENLELMTGKHGAGVRVTDMVAFCVNFLMMYSPEKLSGGGGK